MIELYYTSSATVNQFMITTRELPKDRETSGLLMADLLSSYNWDSILLPPCADPQTCFSLVSPLLLCNRSSMPCALSLKGNGVTSAQTAGITMINDASILCDAKQG